MTETQEWFTPAGLAPKMWDENTLNLSKALPSINQRRMVYMIKDEIKRALFPEPTEEEVAENGPFDDINPYLPDDARRYIGSYINLFVKQGVLSYFDIVELVSNPSEFRVQIFIERRVKGEYWSSEFTVSKRFNGK